MITICVETSLTAINIGSKKSLYSVKTQERQFVSADSREKYERQERVDSCLLVKSYLESVPRSEFETTTDIRRTPGHRHVIDHQLLKSATFRPSRVSVVLPLCRISCRSRPAICTHTSDHLQRFGSALEILHNAPMDSEMYRFIQ